jgi:probable F420-dependent oxidoreductase
MGYLAAITQRIGLCTGILILPQRQTALVAKQAAEVDVLSGGRLRLGVGIGWNHVEYEALGEDFHNRGRRSEEQIEVMRALWSQEVVDFRGRWHRIDNAGLNPLPVQRPIPVWLGAGGSAGPVPPERALRRVARIADGWFPFITPDQRGQEVLGRLREYIKEAGRDPSAVGIEPRIRIANRPPEEWLKELKAWEAMGASSVTMEARQGRLPRPAAEHIEALHQFKEVVGW